MYESDGLTLRPVEGETDSPAKLASEHMDILWKPVFIHLYTLKTSLYSLVKKN